MTFTAQLDFAVSDNLYVRMRKYTRCTTSSNSLKLTFPTMPYTYNIYLIFMTITGKQCRIRGDGLIFAKYFKKSAKLTKIYQKKLGGASSPNPVRH